jgi:mono/diheme cytochrome c family protein
MGDRHAVLAWVATAVAASLLSACASSPRETMHVAGESGATLFRLNCASCHGVEGHGDGPAAKSMSVSVPDLTRIAERRGGRFPREEVARIVDGLSPLAAHGSREMPVWGYEFFDPRLEDEAAHALAVERVDRLVEYLASIQARGPD